MIRLENFKFDYEPYPMGYAEHVFEPSFYDDLVNSFPDLDVMQDTDHGSEGSKFSLSEVNNPDVFSRHVAAYPRVAEFRTFIKSTSFITAVLSMLTASGINLKLGNVNPSRRRMARLAVDALRSGNVPVFPPAITARFEYSALPTDTGCVYPHTDSPAKIINFVVPIYKDGEWPDEEIGGTSSLRTKNPAASFNYENRMVPFDEVDHVKTYPFKRNAALVFVKTYNSLHGVFPMKTLPRGLIRKTITIQLIRTR